MPSATAWGRTGGLVIALGACLALACPAVAVADSPDSNSSSHSVGHTKPKAGVASPARNRAPSRPPSLAKAPVSKAVRTGPAMAARTLNPVESLFSTLFGALESARREFEHTLFNKAPTIRYDPTKNSLTPGSSTITGNVAATDPEGDPLAYKIKGQPTSGTVTIDAHGTFVYTPGTPMQPGDTAQFVVAVIDRGIGLHGIASLFSPQTAATTTATITVAAIDGQPPQLSISDATTTEPGGKTGAGFWHTNGNQIVDAAGNPVRIAGVNWFGFDTDTGTPHGLWARNYKDMMDQMVALGFNTIRLPYSQDILHEQFPVGNSINFYLNPDLQGLTPIQLMDKVIDYAGEIGLKVILDHHRNEAGAGTTANGLWYDDKYSETDWVNDWVTLAARYADNPTVIGVDLHNEPYNGSWGGGGANDWARAAERAGNAVLAVNPNLLIFVEGIGSYNNQYYWWGGNLMGVKDRPIVLNVPNRVVYSPHDYPNSLFPQAWFSGDDFGAGLPDVFTNAWGYIYQDGIAPIYVGEFGTSLTDPKDIIWFEALTSYLSGDFDNNGTVDIPSTDAGIGWTYWAWNASNADNGGILADDWITVLPGKMTYLAPIQFDFGDRTGTSVATFTVTLASTSTRTVTVHYVSSDGTATEGTDYVGASGTLTFLPGETSKTLTVTVLADSTAENNETFTVVLSTPVNATLADSTGVGTIVDHSVA